VVFVKVVESDSQTSTCSCSKNLLQMCMLSGRSRWSRRQERLTRAHDVLPRLADGETNKHARRVRCTRRFTWRWVEVKDGEGRAHNSFSRGEVLDKVHVALGACGRHICNKKVSTLRGTHLGPRSSPHGVSQQLEVASEEAGRATKRAVFLFERCCDANLERRRSTITNVCVCKVDRCH